MRARTQEAEGNGKTNSLFGEHGSFSFVGHVVLERLIIRFGLRSGVRFAENYF